MTVIQARPTTYNGVRMRSRLEADYAASLDRRGIKWTYEPDCFANEDGQWLPDFRADDYLVEVKPAGVLRELPSVSLQFEEADKYLRQMSIAWSSEPTAWLSLVFWDYGAPWAYLTIVAYSGRPWVAWSGECDIPLLWPGMGQMKTLDDLELPKIASKTKPPEPETMRIAAVMSTLPERWAGIVGPLADHTSPGHLSETGVFVIHAESTAWATQTRLCSELLVDALNAIFSTDAVKRIKVRVNRGGA